MRKMIRGIALGGVIAASADVGTAIGAEPDPLLRYRWVARVLVIAAPNADDPGLAAQRDILSTAGIGVAERDLVAVEAIGRQPRADALRHRFRLPDDRFAVVLVGKDGGAKVSSDAPIPSRLLFSTIDAMPMRREEMRNHARSP